MKSEAAARTSWSSSCSSANRLLHKASVVDRPDTHRNDEKKLRGHVMTDSYFTTLTQWQLRATQHTSGTADQDLSGRQFHLRRLLLAAARTHQLPPPTWDRHCSGTLETVRTGPCKCLQQSSMAGNISMSSMRKAPLRVKTFHLHHRKMAFEKKTV